MFPMTIQTKKPLVTMKEEDLYQRGLEPRERNGMEEFSPSPSQQSLLMPIIQKLASWKPMPPPLFPSAADYQHQSVAHGPQLVPSIPPYPPGMLPPPPQVGLQPPSSTPMASAFPPPPHLRPPFNNTLLQVHQQAQFQQGFAQQHQPTPQKVVEEPRKKRLLFAINPTTGKAEQLVDGAPAQATTPISLDNGSSGSDSDVNCGDSAAVNTEVPTGGMPKENQPGCELRHASPPTVLHSHDDSDVESKLILSTDQTNTSLSTPRSTQDEWEIVGNDAKENEAELADSKEGDGETGEVKSQAFVYDEETLFMIRELVKPTKDEKAISPPNVQLPPAPFLKKSPTPSIEHRVAAKKLDFCLRNMSRSPVGKAVPKDPPASVVVRSTGAWVPRRAKEVLKMEGALPEEGIAEQQAIRLEQEVKEIRRVLNKITPTTYEELASQFCAHKIYSTSEANGDGKRLLSEVVELIFAKAVQEPAYCPLYSDLCKRQCDEERADTGLRTFVNAIIKKCQETFENEMNRKQKSSCSTSADESGAVSLEELEREDAQMKRRMLGTITLMSQLHRHSLLSRKVLAWCVTELCCLYARRNDEIYVEYASQLFRTTAPKFQKEARLLSGDNKPSADDASWNAAYRELAALRGKLSSRVDFMLLDLEEMQQSGWVEAKRGGAESRQPKTLQELEKEARLERQRREEQVKEYMEKKRQTRGTNNSPSRPWFGGKHREQGGSPAWMLGQENSQRNEVAKEEKRMRAVTAAERAVSTSREPCRKTITLKQAEAFGNGKAQKKSSIFAFHGRKTDVRTEH